MGKKWNIGLIFINVCLLFILFVRFEPFTTNDVAYLSLIATLIGVMITFGVGFQIYGMININEKNKELENQNREIKQSLIDLIKFKEEISVDLKEYKTNTTAIIEDHSKEQYELLGHINITRAQFLEESKKHNEAFSCNLRALKAYMEAKNESRSRSVLSVLLTMIQQSQAFLFTEELNEAIIHHIDEKNKEFIDEFNFREDFDVLKSKVQSSKSN